MASVDICPGSKSSTARSSCSKAGTDKSVCWRGRVPVVRYWYDLVACMWWCEWWDVLLGPQIVRP